jgi:hypothetical protein
MFCRKASIASARLFANATRNDNLQRARQLLDVKAIETMTPGEEETNGDGEDASSCTFTCRQCGQPLIVIEILSPQHAPRAPPQRHAA